MSAGPAALCLLASVSASDQTAQDGEVSLSQGGQLKADEQLSVSGVIESPDPKNFQGNPAQSQNALNVSPSMAMTQAVIVESVVPLNMSLVEPATMQDPRFGNHGLVVHGLRGLTMHTISYSSMNPDNGGAGSSHQQQKDRLKEKQKKYRHRQGQLVRELGELLPSTNGMRSLNQILTAAVAAVRSYVSNPGDGAPEQLKSKPEEESRNVGKGGRALANWHADICSYRRLPFLEGLFSTRYTAVGVVDQNWQFLGANDAMCTLLMPHLAIPGGFASGGKNMYSILRLGDLVPPAVRSVFASPSSSGTHPTDGITFQVDLALRGSSTLVPTSVDVIRTVRQSPARGSYIVMIHVPMPAVDESQVLACDVDPLLNPSMQIPA